MVDYSNTIIYKITCNEPTVLDTYVGHTTNFVQRKHAHKQSCVNTKSANYKCKLYETIRNNGGWSNWHMEIIHFFNCKNHYEARQKEQEYFVLLNANLNSIEPFPLPKPSHIKVMHYCEVCNIYCSNLDKFNIHNQTAKHIKNINIRDTKLNSSNDFVTENSGCGASQNVTEKQHEVIYTEPVLSTNNSELTPKNKFCCIKCNLYTCSKKDFYKHTLTHKHVIGNDLNPLEQMSPKKTRSKKNICKCCNKEYNSRNGLWYHEKKCSVKIHDDASNLENKISVTDSGKINRLDDNYILLELLRQNKELKNLIIEQNKNIVEILNNNINSISS
jgi:hypothetical protein